MIQVQEPTPGGIRVRADAPLSAIFGYIIAKAKAASHPNAKFPAGAKFIMRSAPPIAQSTLLRALYSP